MCVETRHVEKKEKKKKEEEFSVIDNTIYPSYQ